MAVAAHRSRQRQRERGQASAELVIATPALLLLVLLVVQFAIWAHATHVAHATAAEALAATRVEGGTVAGGTTQARAVLAQIGGDILIDPRVTVTRGGEAAHVEVRGTAPPVVPGLRLPVWATAHGPVERFEPDLRR